MKNRMKRLIQGSGLGSSMRHGDPMAHERPLMDKRTADASREQVTHSKLRPRLARVGSY